MAKRIKTSKALYDLLVGGDLRSKGKSETVAASVGSQRKFDMLFRHLGGSGRLAAMRAADAIEKITIHHPEFLNKHKKQILLIARTATDKELQWHLAQLIGRLPLKGRGFLIAWDLLMGWLRNTKNSRIVRVFSLQSLYDLSKIRPELRKELALEAENISKQNIPSLNSRIRRLF